jgi:hypothetical protein
VKPAGISGINEGISEGKTNELAMNGRNRSVRDLYRGIN